MEEAEDVGAGSLGRVGPLVVRAGSGAVSA